ncbi:hypothetical protein COL516b_001417 [Colletotrichum fioriniae]|nr:uncharacterized protein COL516b_001417 [Colletotrichum fioriniae]KAJ0312341.1 hypothetical protein COL516b_001417 [Colletotrichum fioriniae]
MPALRGLDDKFQRVMQDFLGQDTGVKDEYLARLWRNDLVEALLKATNHRRILNIGVDRDLDSEAWENILAERNRLKDWHQSGDVKEMCFSSLAEPYDVFIEFVPDDPPGLLKKWGSDLTEVVVLLLGTRDFAPEKGAYGKIGGLSNPVKISRKSPGERENDEVNDEDTAVVAILPACELPSELVEAFVEDTEYPRFTTFLVLKELRLGKGKYERLGCFDVWSRNDIGVAKALFSSSAKETVTII